MSFLAQSYDIQYRFRLCLAGHVRRLRGRKKPTVPSQPESILFVLTGLLGDTLMSFPVLLEARRLWPNAKISVLTNRTGSELLNGSPYVDSCLLAPAIPFSLSKRRVLRQLDTTMQEERFDISIILLGDQFAPALERARIPVRVGVAAHPLESFLTHVYDIGSPRMWGPNERLNSLRAIGCEVQDVPAKLHVSETSRRAARKLLREYGATGGPYAVIHPFGRTDRQRWPLENLPILAKAIRSQYDLETVVIGAPQDKIHDFARSEVINTLGRLSLAEVIAVIDEAKIVITTDSGPFRIAGVLARPIVGLFRKSRPEHAVRYTSARAVLGSEPRCSDCCRWDWCRTAPCLSMQAITVSDVLAEAAKL